MKISAKKEKKSESIKEEKQDLEDLKNLEAQNLILQEMITLKEDSYFRHKLLNLLERQAQALESLNQDVKSLVDLEKEESEEDEAKEDEEDEED